MSFLDFEITQAWIIAKLKVKYQNVYVLQTGVGGNVLFLCENIKNSIMNFIPADQLERREERFFYWKHENSKGWFEGGNLFGISGKRGITKTINADLVRQFIVARRADVLFSIVDEIKGIKFIDFMDKSIHNHIQISNKEEVYVILNSELKEIDELI